VDFGDVLFDTCINPDWASDTLELPVKVQPMVACRIALLNVGETMPLYPKLDSRPILFTEIKQAFRKTEH
jgi:hypothetical protein